MLRRDIRYVDGQDQKNSEAKAEIGGENQLRNCYGAILTMIPALIFAFSCGTLGQFFMSYCRSLLLSYAQIELSSATREVIGMEPSEIRGDHFRRLLSLVRLAPNPGDDKWDLRAVRIYYAAVRMAALIASPIGPAMHNWAEKQANLCAYFAAAVLERRIASVTAN